MLAIKLCYQKLYSLPDFCSFYHYLAINNKINDLNYIIVNNLVRFLLSAYRVSGISRISTSRVVLFGFILKSPRMLSNIQKSHLTEGGLDRVLPKSCPYTFLAAVGHQAASENEQLTPAAISVKYV